MYFMKKRSNRKNEKAIAKVPRPKTNPAKICNNAARYTSGIRVRSDIIEANMSLNNDAQMP